MMDAVFTEDAYKVLMNGEVVDNNGLRSKKGNYWPDQPSFDQKINFKKKLRRRRLNLQF